MTNSLFKRLLVPVLVIILALSVGACTANTSDSADTTGRTGPEPTTSGTSPNSTAKTQPAPQECRGEKLLPIDEAGENPDFKEFRDQLLAAVKRKDVNFLKQHIHKNISGSFGSEGNGIDSFMQLWELDKDPENSKLWLELGEALRLGGTFTNPSKTMFSAPYIYSSFPDTYDAFTHAVVIGSNVNLRSAAKEDSRVIGRLNYHILKLLEPSSDSGGWVKVQTTAGESGYVLGKYLRSPIDYRVGFSKDGDIWKMTFFIAGD